MLRHEQQTVRMALAAALHHSAGPMEKVEMQQNSAPRGQKIAARAGEVEEPLSWGFHWFRSRAVAVLLVPRVSGLFSGGALLQHSLVSVHVQLHM